MAEQRRTVRQTAAIQTAAFSEALRNRLGDDLPWYMRQYRKRLLFLRWEILHGRISDWPESERVTVE